MPVVFVSSRAVRTKIQEAMSAVSTAISSRLPTASPTSRSSQIEAVSPIPSSQPSLFESKAAIQGYPALGTFHLYSRRQGLQPIKGATSLDIQKLGGADSRLSFQTFPLPKPLTFLADSVGTPPYSAELEIRVDGRLWQPVPTFFDAAPDAEIYLFCQSEDGDFAQFGDGINGAKLPSGRNNVTAAYRTGSGSFGDLTVDEEPKVKGKLKPLTGASMPGPVTGGAAPEQMAGAREAAPGRMQSPWAAGRLDRL